MFARCPFDLEHRMPVEALSPHILRCPASPFPRTHPAPSEPASDDLASLPSDYDVIRVAHRTLVRAYPGGTTGMMRALCGRAMCGHAGAPYNVSGGPLGLLVDLHTRLADWEK